MDRESTAKGDGWVEYSYVINLQDNTLGVYGHIDQDPMKVYSLDNLPKDKEFISDIKSIEAE
jgi:hypothetical protein